MKISAQKTLIPAFFLLLFCGLTADAQTPNAAPKIPAEVEAIAGTLTGSWTTYTLNDKGETIKQMSWTDVIRAEKPAIAGDRAFVETTDELTFDGGRIPPQKVLGKEGYFIGKDGSLGDYFIEFFGQTVAMKKLGKDIWAYTIPANAREFAMLGDKFISGTHVLVKATVVDQGVETHNITRITTVRWKDAEGKERLTQFVSLQGQHRKSK
jgi:hypothetical protein